MANKRIIMLRRFCIVTKLQIEIADYTIRLTNEHPQVFLVSTILEKVYEKYGKDVVTRELCSDVFRHLRHTFLRVFGENQDFVTIGPLGLEYCDSSLYGKIKRFFEW